MADSIRLIKKYPNRRLYDTQTSAYITLADVKELVLKNEKFQVLDAKSAEDLTRAILLQIILEEESSGTPMFSCDVLTQFIRCRPIAFQINSSLCCNCMHQTLIQTVHSWIIELTCNGSKHRH